MYKETQTYRRRALNELDGIEAVLNLFRRSLAEGNPTFWSTQGLVGAVDRLGEELKNWKESHEADRLNG